MTEATKGGAAVTVGDLVDAGAVAQPVPKQSSRALHWSDIDAIKKALLAAVGQHELSTVVMLGGVNELRGLADGLAHAFMHLDAIAARTSAAADKPPAPDKTDELPRYTWSDKLPLGWHRRLCKGPVLLNKPWPKHKSRRTVNPRAADPGAVRVS